jgi:FdhD protein
VEKEIGLEWVDYTKVNNAITQARERVVAEFPLSLTINGKALATAMITPTMEKEFIVGHLFGQGIIDSAGDLASIVVDGHKAEITLATKQRVARKSQKVHSVFTATTEDIFTGVKAILKSAVFKETEAVHSAGLFKAKAEVICIADDIGRHNALDKVIGYGMLNGVDFGNTFVASTGRIPSEMVLRCCNANVPIIASKGIATSMAIEIARKAKLTIVGMVRGDGMIIYSTSEKIK